MAWLGTLWWCLLETCSGLCDKLRYGSACKPFPGPVSDDLLMEIFSRLPADCVHQCKLVYEDWNTLFSSPYFDHTMFLPRASPTIIVHRWSLYENKLFYIDDDHRGGLKCTQISQKNPLINFDYWPRISKFNPVRFSCYGLLFLDVPDYDPGKISRVVNPITGRWVSLPSVPNVRGEICGAYFHPTAREFRVLWVSSWIMSKNNLHVEFKLLRPRSETHPRICWNPLTKLQYRPPSEEAPVNLHDCLHWTCGPCGYGPAYAYYSELILVFSIIREEFKLMPSIPGLQPMYEYKQKLPHLLDLDGYLSLWELTDVLNIWTVEDYYASRWSWTKRYNIDVKLLHRRVNVDEVSVVGCQNGALVIHWIGKGIFVYHLKHKSTKKLLLDKLKESEYYSSSTTPFLHTKSLISMTGFPENNQRTVR